MASATRLHGALDDDLGSLGHLFENEILTRHADLTMTLDKKLELDVRDFWRIHDGLETYAKLDVEAKMERLKTHKEDAFCEVSNHLGDGTLMCTRDGYNAMVQLAERHRESMAVQGDYSVEELVKGIRKYIVRAMVDEKQDEHAVARVLSEAVNEADKNHVQRTYHFPCVVVPYEEPPQFRVGAVVFTAARAFSQIFAQELREFVETSRDEKYSNERVQRFQEHTSNFGWVASVTVPPCAEEPAKRRAEVAVTTAINLLRLAFGVHYGRDMRVAHVTYTRPSKIEYAVTENGRITFVWSRKSSGALVEKDWYRSMQNWQEFWNLAAHLVATTVVGKRSEISYRVEDALTWFGNAAFESAPGTQIVNFVAALERLTTTETFSTHKFCSRVAILAHEDEKDFEKTYWNAYTVHTARSGVIHGGFSPTSSAFLKKVGIAHDVTRGALFRGLEVHYHLDDSGKTGSLGDLQNFFTKQQSKWSATLKKLESELKAKKKSGYNG